MGYYLNGPDLSPWGKVSVLINSHGAKIASVICFPPLEKGQVLICVFDAGTHEAAAICYSASEFNGFKDPMGRRSKTWLYISREKALELCPGIGDTAL